MVQLSLPLPSVRLLNKMAANLNNFLEGYTFWQKFAVLEQSNALLI